MSLVSLTPVEPHTLHSLDIYPYGLRNNFVTLQQYDYHDMTYSNMLLDYIYYHSLHMCLCQPFCTFNISYVWTMRVRHSSNYNIP